MEIHSVRLNNASGLAVRAGCGFGFIINFYAFVYFEKPEKPLVYLKPGSHE